MTLPLQPNIIYFRDVPVRCKFTRLSRLLWSIRAGGPQGPPHISHGCGSPDTRWHHQDARSKWSVTQPYSNARCSGVGVSALPPVTYRSMLFIQLLLIQIYVYIMFVLCKMTTLKTTMCTNYATTKYHNTHQLCNHSVRWRIIITIMAHH